jgi:hypothetical protein
MIRSMQCIFLRALVRALNKQGCKLHEIASRAAISVPELQRLVKFGSRPDRETVERLTAFSRTMLRQPSEVQKGDDHR